MSCATIPPILASLIARITAAVPARARTTFLDLLLGAAATKGGHVTDAILAGGLSRGWRPYYWFLQQGRWSWLRVWAALLEVLTTLFRPAVWYVVIDDSVVERVSTEAPGSLMHHNHNAKPNRPKFLRGQGWLCLAAVIERNAFAVGAVPLLLRLVHLAGSAASVAGCPATGESGLPQSGSDCHEWPPPEAFLRVRTAWIWQGNAHALP